MNEAYLKSCLVKKLRSGLATAFPGLLPEAVQRHEDKFTGGKPDVSATRGRATCWVEVKWGRGTATALQATALRALDGLLVTYRERPAHKETRVADCHETDLVVVKAPKFHHEAVVEVVVDRLRSEHDLVRAFQEKYGIVSRGVPTLDLDSLQKRLDHFSEEIHETRRAMAENDLAGVADGLVDLAYLVHGAAVNLGLPWPELFREVHRANMEKVRAGGAVLGDPKKWSVVKPAGWRGPDIHGILERYGMKEEGAA